MYSLILSSKLPSAREFKRWVTSVVLPQIRKTGSYHQESPVPVDEEHFGEFADRLPKNFHQALLQMADMEDEIQYYKPRAKRFDLYMSSRFYWTTTQIAENYGLSARELNNLLHQFGVQYKQGERWYLYAQYKGNGSKWKTLH
ncbi:phage antirepressor KilAC domain-containing protein [Nicoliella lavandulae]